MTFTHLKILSGLAHESKDCAKYLLTLLTRAIIALIFSVSQNLYAQDINLGNGNYPMLQEDSITRTESSKLKANN